MTSENTAVSIAANTFNPPSVALSEHSAARVKQMAPTDLCAVKVGVVVVNTEDFARVFLPIEQHGIARGSYTKSAGRQVFTGRCHSATSLSASDRRL